MAKEAAAIEGGGGAQGAPPLRLLEAGGTSPRARL